MFRALFRKALADLKTRRTQSMLIGLILALATAVLTLSIALIKSDSDANPWDRVFAKTKGAQAWFSASSPDTDLSSIGALPGVNGSIGPLPFVQGPYLSRDGEKYGLGLLGLGPSLPAVGGPSVTEGAWLSASGTDEIVLDRGLARAMKVGVGDEVEITTSAGKSKLKVIGLAVNPSQGPYPSVQPGLGYARPETLSRLEPDQRYWTWKFGLRLSDPKTLPASAIPAIGTKRAISGCITPPTRPSTSGSSSWGSSP